ncbi:MAG: Hsp70 family protein [Rhizobiaceae bacterium]|nr:Hsp70 family protein [Rhizobiaceae bacterium]
MTTTFAGIDFGTSNSTVAVMKGGKPRLVQLEGGNATMPSAVFFGFEHGEVSYGRAAIERYVEGVEGRLMRALKSVLGSNLIFEKTRIKARSIAFAEIIGLFIAQLKKKLDEDAQHQTKSVVLGRPVHFVDNDEIADARAQDELEKAARAQGFENVAFQFEPIAAALDYENTISSEQLALVVDMGGGTSDFSIVRVSPERAKAADRKTDVLASTGIHIGGTDFDRLLSIAHVMPHLGYLTPTRDGKRNLPASYFVDLATWQRINFLYTSQAMRHLRQIRYEARHPELVDRFIAIVEHRYGHALAGSVEAAKIELTDALAAQVKVDLPDVRFVAEMTREGLEKTLGGDVDRVVATVRETIVQAGIKPAQITSVFLTGGSTALPIARQRILALFPDANVVQGDMFGSVGLGLALDAQRKFA